MCTAALLHLGRKNMTSGLSYFYMKCSLLSIYKQYAKYAHNMHCS